MSSVSKTIFNNLRKLDIKNVFGYTGGAILPVINQFYKNNNIKMIIPKTESCASFMAEGYAKMNLNKKPGVVISTSGPGATNLVTSLQNALMDGTPLMALTGQVSTNVLGTDAFQEADILNITKPCTKWNTMLKNAKDTEYIINKAYDVSLVGRPGPVLIDLPKNILLQETTIEESKRWKSKRQEVNENLTNEIIDKIRNAKKPIIISGQGMLDQTEGLRMFVKKHNIPVTTTLLGLGAINENDKHALEMLGMHGSYTANKMVQESDFILVLGARLDDRVTCNPQQFGKNAKQIVHIDIRNSNKHKTVKNTTFINSNVKNIMEQLNNIPINENLKEDRNRWLNYSNFLKTNYPFYTDNKKELTCGYILNELNNIIQQTNYKKYCIVADVGVHQMMAAQNIKYNYPRVKYITSGGLGSMGFALPAAMGAKIAKPEYEVICVVGDGGFNMSFHELQTMKDYNIDIKVIVMNNNCQQMVKMWQNYFYEQRYIGVDNNNPRYDIVAKSLGVKGITLREKSKVNKVLTNILNNQEGVVIDAIISRNEYAYPIVLPGKGLDEMTMK